MSEPAAESENVWTSYSTRDRTLLTVGAVISYVIFVLVGRMFDIPQLPKYQADLLGQPSPIIVLIVVLVTLLACVLIGSLVAGIVHFESGLFCGCIGMLALSTRGGAMRDVLMYAGGPGVYVRLMAELVMLAGCIGVGWYGLMVLRDMELLRGEPLREDDPDALPAQGAMALGATVIIMIFLMILLAQTDKKAQAIWAVIFSSMLATMGSHSLFPARPSIWFWTAPLIVGVIGYAFAWAGGPAGVGGDVGGMLPALARPLPVDYACAGTAGALYGYWTSRRWQHERETEPHTTGEVEEALESA
jgi:hypothetical protein